MTSAASGAKPTRRRIARARRPQIAERHSARDLADQQQAHRGGRHRAVGGQLDDREERHHPEAVVEQGLAGQLHLQRLGGGRGPQHAEHGDRIGGRDERAEEQRLPGGDAQSQRLAHRQDQPTHDSGRHQHAAGREQPDCQLLAQQRVEIDVQGAGEQQKGQQAVEQRFAEVQPPDGGAGVPDAPQAGALGGEQRDRAQERQERRGDREWKAAARGGGHALAIAIVSGGRRGGDRARAGRPRRLSSRRAAASRSSSAAGGARRPSFSPGSRM